MTIKFNSKYFYFFVPALFLLPFSTMAVDGLSLSVTPTLFEMSAEPNQVWSSQVKVINSNSYPITVYAKVVNFAPQGEAGEGKFLPVFEDFTEGTTLAEWIEINTESVTIPPETSQGIPFTVRVPENPSPGGHFAAIMIGTKPPENNDKLKVSTSQVVTSLFFVRMAGEVVEDGVIREFTVDKRFVATPHADLYIRFENKGNVHVQPQGQIEITNMWGKERGIIPINSRTHFGNVLPNSIRKFEFSWEGEPSISDIGLYKASVTLGYGYDNKQFESSATYFYVIPVKASLIVLVSLILGIWFISWCIKAYIRRMLALSGVDMQTQSGETMIKQRPLLREGDVLIQKSHASVKAPFKIGISEFSNKLKASKKITTKAKSLAVLIYKYRLFFIAIVGIISIGLILVIFIKDVFSDQKNYSITIENTDKPVKLSSEDIIYESKQVQNDKVSNSLVESNTANSSLNQNFNLKLINAGDKPGAAAAMRNQLEKSGYVIEEIGSDHNTSQARTVVVYSTLYEKEALELSKILNNALLSARPDKNEVEPLIEIFIGDDYIF